VVFGYVFENNFIKKSKDFVLITIIEKEITKRNFDFEYSVNAISCRINGEDEY
jgi:hypothetical protein